MAAVVDLIRCLSQRIWLAMKKTAFLTLSLLLLTSMSPSQSNVGRDDFGAQEVAERLVARMTKVCDGNLISSDGVEFRGSTSVVANMTEISHATEAELAKDSTYLGSAKFDVNAEGASAYRYLGHLGVGLRGQLSPSEWKNFANRETGFFGTNGLFLQFQLKIYEERVSLISLNLYSWIFTNPDLARNISYAGWSSAWNTLASHPEYDWAPMTCEDFKIPDVAIMKMFYHSDDRSLVDQLFTPSHRDGEFKDLLYTHLD